jgi:hypothetical protein
MLLLPVTTTGGDDVDGGADGSVANGSEDGGEVC